MRQAILSDIHGNLEALHQVLRRVEMEKCDRILCLGDCVGYGPFPSECVDLLYRSCTVVLAGNHDYGLLGWTSTESFNEFARRALRVSAPLMTEQTLEQLRNSPLTWQDAKVFCVHATPLDPESWHYLLSIYDADIQWNVFSQSLGFFGHTHTPMAICQTAQRHTVQRTAADLQLQPGERYLLNVGSVGQPRDGNPDACFVVHDVDEQRVRWVRVPYDIDATQRAMQQLRIPEFLIRRLTFGH